MKKYIFIIFLAVVLSACTPSEIEATKMPAALPTSASDLTSEVESNVDILANLPAATCESGLTPENQEGPYYKEGSPETLSLFTEGMQGTRLILAGMVLNQDCLPIPNVWLDFWQTDSEGNYDNNGYVLRGHQYTDNKGRYYLETILPGQYSSRPIEHIHVKVEASSGKVLVTQLYFPEQPVDGLTVSLDDRGDYFLGYFNFVIQIDGN